MFYVEVEEFVKAKPGKKGDPVFRKRWRGVDHAFLYTDAEKLMKRLKRQNKYGIYRIAEVRDDLDDMRLDMPGKD